MNNVALARLEFEQMVGFLGESPAASGAAYSAPSGQRAAARSSCWIPELVDAPSVDRAFLLRPGIGYIRVNGFDPQTGKQFKDAIEKLGGEKLKGLVLDLRDNPGGVVQSGAGSGFVFPEARPKDAERERAQHRGASRSNVPKTATPYAFPLAVLVNDKTASASEILTGALQDHDRAVVVGEPSFGKGLVQNVFPLSGNTALALTTAFYYTPSGRSIQKPLPSGQLEIEKQAEQFRTDSGRTVTGGGGIQPDIAVGPEPQTRLRMVLDASGIMTSFATGVHPEARDQPIL